MSESSSSSLSPLSPRPTTSSHSRPRPPRLPHPDTHRQRQTSRAGLEELLSKLEQSPELVAELLREVRAREESSLEIEKQGGQNGIRRPKQCHRSGRGSEEESTEDETMLESKSRTKVSNQYTERGSTYPPRPIHQQRPPGSSSDSENSKLLQHTTRRSEETSSEASEESGEGEAASLLSGVRRTEFDIEMDAGHRRGRTTVTRGGPVSSMRDLVHNAASFVRGRSPNRRPRFSISPSPPASRSSSQSSRRSVSPSLTQYQDPVLGPFPRPKIKVDFKFPSSFNSTGLPNYPQNKYLPRRLQEQVSERQHLSAQQREVIEAGKHWRRARRRNRNSRGGEGEAEQGGPMFPCLLAAVLVVLPIALLSVVLGLVFRFAEVRI